jgi:hypothetical protein
MSLRGCAGCRAPPAPLPWLQPTRPLTPSPCPCTQTRHPMPSTTQPLAPAPLLLQWMLRHPLLSGLGTGLVALVLLSALSPSPTCKRLLGKVVTSV